MKLQLRQFNQSGEVFVCDLDNMTMSEILSQSEQSAPLEDYNLDSDMDQKTVNASHVIR